MKIILRPDGFAIGLFLLGLALFLVPLMIMPGLVAMLAAVAYWLTLSVFRVVKRPRF